MFMLEQRQPNFMKEQLFLWIVFLPISCSSDVTSWTSSHSLSSLDETAHFLIVGRNTRRPWQKQACPHCRNRSVAKSRRVMHVGATRSPTDAWVAQQLREATPFGQAPKSLMCDHDSKFGSRFARVAATTDIELLRTPYQAPRANAWITS